MALATQCPSCKARFRVQVEHLKASDGMVRCGMCRHVFNAMDHLARIPSAPPDAPREQPETQVTPPAARQLRAEQVEILALLDSAQNASSIQSKARLNAVLTPLSETVAAADTMHLPDPESGQGDSGPRTLMSPEPSSFDPNTVSKAQLETVMRDHSSRQPALEDDTTQTPPVSLQAEPVFLQRLDRQAQRRSSHWLAGVGVGFGLLLLLAQSAYVWRADLAARLPVLQSGLQHICDVLKCQIGLPQHVDQLRISGSELQPDIRNRDLYTLAFTLENQGASPQAWPHLELTLTDVQNRAVARRVFEPEEYISTIGKNTRGLKESPAANPNQGIPSLGEFSPRIYFDAGNIKAAGYLIYIFYP